MENQVLFVAGPTYTYKKFKMEDYYCFESQ